LLGTSWLATDGPRNSSSIVVLANDELGRHAHGMRHLFVNGSSANRFAAVMAFT